MQQYSLGILDDEPLILAALTSELSPFFSIKYTATNSRAFYENLKTQTPDLVLLDIMLDGDNGISVAQSIRENFPNVKILVLSIDNRRETFRRLLEVGVEGFVSKKAQVAEVVHAIDVILCGNKYYGRDSYSLIRDIQISMMEGKEPMLTQLEMDLLYACCEGKSSAEIGKAMHMSPRTVEAHKSTIFVKLGVNSTIELVVKAIQIGIVTL